jgi:hypothetical protein
MVSTNDHKKIGVVKGTTAKFKGIILKQNGSLDVEIWNGYKVYTARAEDVENLVCESTKKTKSIFMIPSRSFDVTVKFPINGGKTLKLAKTKIIQFPINNDLATTGHKLQGKTKKVLIISQLNYSTPNWIYVVLSRVTSLSGLFLLQPLKHTFNPQPTKILLDEWMNQKNMEIELIRLLQKNGNFPNYIDIINASFLCDQTQMVPTTERNITKQQRKRAKVLEKENNQEKLNESINVDTWLSRIGKKKFHT